MTETLTLGIHEADPSKTLPQPATALPDGLGNGAVHAIETGLPTTPIATAEAPVAQTKPIEPILKASPMVIIGPYNGYTGDGVCVYSSSRFSPNGS